MPPPPPPHLSVPLAWPAGLPRTVPPRPVGHLPPTHPAHPARPIAPSKPGLETRNSNPRTKQRTKQARTRHKNPHNYEDLNPETSPFAGMWVQGQDAPLHAGGPGRVGRSDRLGEWVPGQGLDFRVPGFVALFISDYTLSLNPWVNGARSGGGPHASGQSPCGRGRRLAGVWPSCRHRDARRAWRHSASAVVAAVGVG